MADEPWGVKMPSSETPAAAEPIPDWVPALQTWKWAWDLHWIGFGSLFTLFAVYSLITLIEVIATYRRTKRGKLSLVITSLLVIFGSVRGLFLFINPYETKQCNLLPTCPTIVSRILFGIALPCITASFSLVHFAFLQVIKLKLYPERLQSGKFLTGVIVFHFSLAIFAETMVSLFADWKALGIFCQSFYIVFYFCLSFSFIYSGGRIVKYVQRNHAHVNRLGETSFRAGTDGKAAVYRPNVSKLVKITYLTVFLGFASCALQLYSIIGVNNMYLDKAKPPEPWPWLIFQTLYRAVEFAAACTLAYVGPRQVAQKRFQLIRCPVFNRPKENLKSSTGSNSSNQKYLTHLVSGNGSLPV
ncbi:proline-rich transmembrane protein 4-like [Stylophora pistillata]|uniref:proline-rich transmembrane protein 4-like n=1 Tax=Stylophora pistillata TaxID=50429 RepID=UPI000C04E1C3|nr:proline-rich transmembrane protein 4-like [Stylophora pistillata]XP_022792064.1 proline-rich transmembrane protein 4-like [Stylophora pistillata]